MDRESSFAAHTGGIKHNGHNVFGFAAVDGANDGPNVAHRARCFVVHDRTLQSVAFGALEGQQRVVIEEFEMQRAECGTVGQGHDGSHLIGGFVVVCGQLELGEIPGPVT